MSDEGKTIMVVFTVIVMLLMCVFVYTIYRIQSARGAISYAIGIVEANQTMTKRNVDEFGKLKAELEGKMVHKGHIYKLKEVGNGFYKIDDK